MEDTWDLKALGLECVFVTTSYLPDVMRKFLEESYGCRVSTHYGLSEMGLGLAVECPESGLYHFNELDTYGELINPESGEPAGDGEEGELVFTTLMRDGMPLLRYRSHDLAKMPKEKCGCGSFLSSIGHVHKRRESIVALPNGARIYPSMFDDFLFQNQSIIDFDISLDRKNRTLVFDVETKASENADAEGIKRLIAQAGLTEEIEIDVRPVPQGSLKQGVHFKKVIKEI